MNALYTHALRQTQSITADLALLESSLSRSSSSGGEAGSSSPYGSYGNPSPSLQGNGVDTAGLNGQIVASLAALQRTVEDYEGMAKRELVEANKGKAQTRIDRIRNDYKELRSQYDSLKQKQSTQRQEADRASLLSTSIAPAAGGGAMQQRRIVPQASSSSLGGNESPYSYSQRATPEPSTTTRGYLSVGSGSSGNTLPTSSNYNRASTKNLYTPRTNAALDEGSFINETGNQLDAFIAQGQAILGNLGNQRDILKSTQRRLLSAANTLGLSREVIGFIERRGRGDMAVFLVGSVVTLISFIMIIRYLG